MSRWFAVRR